MPQPCEATCVANWLNENPICLTVAAGRVAKSDLANALNITTASLRHKIAILRASDPAFDDLYQEKSKRTEVPLDLAEVIIRQLFDGNPHVRLEFVPAAVV
ncbi:MAG: hypothetical protein L6Q97_08480 [Thermoanaerobaculia bacterium]|nr:hypothetical protein [Thermoanaerobaculia bacterium]